MEKSMLSEMTNFDEEIWLHRKNKVNKKGGECFKRENKGHLKINISWG